MKLNLSGEWKLIDNKKEYSVKCNIPGDNYTALLNAKKIVDPYLGNNEKFVQWVAQKDWVFEKSFQVTRDLLDHQQILLHLNEIDTIAKIYINKKLVGVSNNMFLGSVFEVKSALKLGLNHISIQIASPVKEAEKLAKKQPLYIPWTSNNTAPFMNLLRKVQCHAGWDWGISVIPSGIYGNIELQGVNTCFLESVYTAQQHRKNECDLTIYAEINSTDFTKKEVTFRFDNKETNVLVDLAKGKNIVEFTFTIINPKLWYPSGYGDPFLHPLSVSLENQKINKKIGLRKLEVINEKDKIGKSLVFRVNGIDIFCKGANWIPADAFPARHTPELIRNLLENAKAANMNMLRVWGGGQYEKDFFYEICDELGILIWQDLMFSCSLYPSTDDFISNVEKEVVYQAKRLRDYACLAIWCGDNEVIGALTWYPESKKNRDAYLVNYDRLNRACEKAVSAGDPTRTFWPSSPCAGPKDFSDNWHNDACGDMHYWSVWHGGKSFDAYYAVKPRFCSEFGYQSFPSFETIKSFATKDDWNATSPVMEAHQKNKGGNTKILEMFARYFRFPVGFENFLYLSQVQQALAIKTGVEFWRHLRPICMGALYWQLNDLWPVASWSSIEYNGNWKQLHYHAKKFFAPVMISAYKKENNVEVWAVNDLLKPIDAEVAITYYDFNGKILSNSKSKIKLKDQGSQIIKKINLDETNRELNSYFMAMTISYKKDGIKITHENALFLTEYKHCELQKSNIDVAIKEISKNEVQLTLKTKKPVFFVHLEVNGVKGYFDDSSFTLLPKIEKKVIYQSTKNININAFKKGLTIKHLRETY